jgi:hypothetical protein
MPDVNEEIEMNPNDAPPGTVLVRKNGIFVKGEDGKWTRQEEVGDNNIDKASK